MKYRVISSILHTLPHTCTRNPISAPEPHQIADPIMYSRLHSHLRSWSCACRLYCFGRFLPNHGHIKHPRLSRCPSQITSLPSFGNLRQISNPFLHIFFPTVSPATDTPRCGCCLPYASTCAASSRCRHRWQLMSGLRVIVIHHSFSFLNGLF
jgi:hypothetical protein